MSKKNDKADGAPSGESKGAEEKPRRPRGPQREIMGGFRLSPGQQLIMKIVCAAVMILCIGGMIGILYGGPGPGEEEPPIDPTWVEVGSLANAAEEKAMRAGILKDRARKARGSGKIDDALALMRQAVEEIETSERDMARAVDKCRDPDTGNIRPGLERLQGDLDRIRSKAGRIRAELEHLEAR